MKNIKYTPMPGWFDLSKLDLPREKLKRYAELQRLGQSYQKKASYHRQYNRVQWGEMKELCAEMQMDLILNYGALETE